MQCYCPIARKLTFQLSLLTFLIADNNPHLSTADVLTLLMCPRLTELAVRKATGEGFRQNRVLQYITHTGGLELELMFEMSESRAF